MRAERNEVNSGAFHHAAPQESTEPVGLLMDIECTRGASQAHRHRRVTRAVFREVAPSEKTFLTDAPIFLASQGEGHLRKHSYR